MPNGGSANCGTCKYLNNDDYCILRDVPITIPFWTSCRNWNRDKEEIDGPLLAIVGEVKNGAIRYGSIPYFKGQRVDTIQEGGGDSVVRFTDKDGKVHEFDSVEDYMNFYEENKD